MTKVKRYNLQKVERWLLEHQGEQFVAKDVSNDTDLSPLHCGIILSNCCHGRVENIGYERTSNNLYARKVYKVRYF